MRIRKCTSRYRILSALAQYPNGLTAAKVYAVISGKYAVDRHTIAVTLGSLCSIGLITKASPQRCECCDKLSVRYKLSAEGKSSLEKAA